MGRSGGFLVRPPGVLSQRACADRCGAVSHRGWLAAAEMARAVCRSAAHAAGRARVSRLARPTGPAERGGRGVRLVGRVGLGFWLAGRIHTGLHRLDGLADAGQRSARPRAWCAHASLLPGEADPTGLPEVGCSHTPSHYRRSSPHSPSRCHTPTLRAKRASTPPGGPRPQCRQAPPPCSRVRQLFP